MSLDQPDEEADGLAEGRPEQHVRRCGTGGEVPEESAEPRSREEYYETLRAVDDDEAADANESGEEFARGESADDGEGPEEAGDRPVGDGAWEAVDAEKRPPLDAISVGPERTTHILDGDPSGGGGHRHRTGIPDKTEFPASWPDKKIIDRALDVARRPDSPPIHQHWNDRWLCQGVRDGVGVWVVVLRSGEVWTAWPKEGSPGVVRNPLKEAE